jgi:hypothetical protein
VFKIPWKLFPTPCHNQMWRTISGRRKTQRVRTLNAVDYGRYSY